MIRWPGRALRDALDRYLVPLGPLEEPKLGAGSPRRGREATAEDSRSLKQSLDGVRRLCWIFLVLIATATAAAVALLLWGTVCPPARPLVAGGMAITAILPIWILRLLWRDAVFTTVALAIVRDLSPTEALKVIRLLRGERFGR